MSLEVNYFRKNILIIFFSFITSILGECTIRIPENHLLVPHFVKTIGSKKIELSYNNVDSFVLHDGQQIEVYCDTLFTSPERYYEMNILNLRCSDNGDFYVNDDNYYIGNNYFYPECSPLKWTLHECSRHFVWCPYNVTSYILNRRSNKESYLAGVCYDTYNLSIKSVYYKIAPKHSKYVHPTHLTYLNPNDLEIKYIKETFDMKSIGADDYDEQILQDWIKYAQYNFSSIKNSYNEYQDQLGSLLDVAWWHNLRLGNWKRYELALAKHVEEENQEYDILSGISDAVEVPVIMDCQTNYTMKELIDNKNRKIPSYVWNHLRATNNSANEIVIIGFNSPFYEFYSEKDVIFCEDKCQEVTWLKKVSTTFRYSALGVIFCCNVEEVRASKRLNGFPELYTIDFTKSATVETTTYNSYGEDEDNVDDENDDNLNY